MMSVADRFPATVPPPAEIRAFRGVPATVRLPETTRLPNVPMSADTEGADRFPTKELAVTLLVVRNATPPGAATASPPMAWMMLDWMFI